MCPPFWWLKIFCCHSLWRPKLINSHKMGGVSYIFEKPSTKNYNRHPTYPHHRIVIKKFQLSFNIPPSLDGDWKGWACATILEKNTIHAPFSFLINEELWLPSDSVGVLDGDWNFLTTRHGVLDGDRILLVIRKWGCVICFQKTLDIFFGKPSLKAFQNHMTCPFFLATKKLRSPLYKGGCVRWQSKKFGHHLT
jgi:hypothetical protein